MLYYIKGPPGGAGRRGAPLGRDELRSAAGRRYTRSPLKDSRLFGPCPWKVLATTYEQIDF